VIDLHCHVLPGIDDGPETIEGSVALASAAAAAGTHTLVATPHVNWRYQNDPDTIAALVGELNARLVADGIALDVRAGAEIAMSQVVDIDPEQLIRFSFGEGSWLLLEPPFTSSVGGLDAVVLDLERNGHRIVLAHPERCPGFHRNREMLESLVNGGVLTSVTAGSLVGRFGGTVRRFALELARDGMVHNVASDAHDHLGRAPGVTAELQQVGLGPLAEWLTGGVPAAILSGREIPDRPEVALPDLEMERPRRFWQRRRS
jgi:protein-tyrosine phosphatase